MLDRQEYFHYYQTRGYLPNGIRPKKSLNEKQLLTRFLAYQRSENRKETRRLEKSERTYSDEQLILDCWARDKECQYLHLLKMHDPEAERDLRQLAGPLLNKQDVAHVFSKGAHSWMRYDLQNVVLLNRHTHSMIDQGKHPMTGKPITPGWKKEFWVLLFGQQGDGEARWNYLEKRARERQ